VYRVPIAPISDLYGLGLFLLQLTIEVLSDDVLLNIFRHYLYATPRFWPMLAWVCQRWRQIVFTSPLGLNLRLYCTHGMPVLKSLDCWPVLPIIVKYGGAPNLLPPALADDENIIAALKQSDRISSVSLTVTSSLLEKLSAISEPFTELEDFVVFSQNSLQLTLPNSFHLGPRLRVLHLIRITIPSLPRLLLLSQDLVDLQLHEIPSAGYFPPDAFANALSGVPQLRSLSLHLISFRRRRSYLDLPPPPAEHIVLPALTRLKYRGISKYLDSIAARINAPRLGDIDITFFSQPTMDALQLGRFMERIGLEMSLSQANVVTYAHAISISLSSSSTPALLRIQISCKQLDWQLSCMAQVCDQLSPFLLRINNLVVNTTEPSSGQADVGGDHWAGLIRVFGCATSFWVAGMHATDILCILRPGGGGHTTDITVLPTLRSLHVDKHMAMGSPLWHALQSFIISRSRPFRVDASVLSYQCHVCRLGWFKEQQILKRHLRDKHAYRIVCSYCDDFKFTPKNDHLFREHLESKHSEVAWNDRVLSDPFLMHLPPSQLDVKLDSLANWHSSLLTPAQTTSYPLSDPWGS
jgi:hypothetical protein